MDADTAAQFLVDDMEGAGSDAELRCAIDGLFEVPPNTGLVANVVSGEHCIVDHSNTLIFGDAYENDQVLQNAHAKSMLLSLGESCSIEPTGTMNMGFPYADTSSIENDGARKSTRDEAFPVPKSKACREKIRRDKLNDRFLELSSVLDPGRAPKCDKASILRDAARALVQLKTMAEELKFSNEKLQETIKELKAEKNELRDEKMRLKSEKERLEQQVKSMTVPPAGFMLHPVAFHPGIAASSFTPSTQTPASKSATIAGAVPTYPSVPMWQWLPPAARDTTQDANLWSPNA